MDWENITDRLTSTGEGVGRWLKGVFGSENERFIRRLEPVVKKIGELEPWAQGLSREEMQAKVAELRTKVAKAIAERSRSEGEGIAEHNRAVLREALEEVMPEMFAMTREASLRTLGLRPYDVQLVGAYVLHQGKIAEMMTGEGKTLVATLPLALNALAGRKVYLVTVNDYLARRDADWMRPIYEYLGLTVGAIQSSMTPWERKPIYDCDIIYGTNNEFGFDYLRDNMKTRLEEQVQSDLYFAIVDEVDSALVDEARTPLIISGPAEEHVGKYKQAHQIALQLERDTHYEVKEKERMASLLEEGIVRAQELLQVESFYVPGFEDWPHYIENALRAKELYRRDKEYVVEEAEDRHTGRKQVEVIIVDEFTGRKMFGRRWSDGLHQAVEVKEGLEPKQETQTLATITFQNYFRMFEKLSGMTGTALTEAGEFHKIYGLDVVTVPTNLPIDRDDKNDLVYRTEPEKWEAIVTEIQRLHEKGQPVLVGTTSVEKSEHLSGLLAKKKIAHEVLNAKIGQWEREAKIVARAGERGAVTVSTNMAGRGTDIKLGGNFEYRLGLALEEAGLVQGDLEHLEEIDRIRQEVRARCDADEKEVLRLGGLYVLGTERHEARRIDNQLRGRSGRQGDVGESRFFLSLEDDLMRIFYRDWVKNMMGKLGMTEGQEIESGMVTRAIARAQKKVEDRNFEIRKSLLEYDEVMDVQRKTIYGVRQKVLEKRGLKTRCLEMLANSTMRSAAVHVDDAAGFKEWCQRTFGFEIGDEAAAEAADPDGRVDAVLERIQKRYEEREAEFGEELAGRLEQYLLLDAIDTRWKDHLHAVDSLKAGIGLRGYGQEDPKIAYKKEGTELFHGHLIPSIEERVASLILRIQVQRPPEAGAEEAAAPLRPRGMGVGVPGGPARPTPEQIDALRKELRRQQAQRAMRQRVPASNAFDLMRRQQAAAAARSAAAVAEPGAKGSAEAPPAAPGAARAPAPARASAGGVAAFEGVGRNEPCPCGSGKKFKKCHGSA